MPAKDPAAAQRKYRRLKAEQHEACIKFWLPDWAVHYIDSLAHLRGESRAHLLRTILMDPKTYSLLKPVDTKPKP